MIYISSLIPAAAVVSCCIQLSTGFHLPQQNIVHHSSSLTPSYTYTTRTTTSLRAAIPPEQISDQTFDLAILGAGPVGVSAALLAARSPHNKNVILIDAPRASGALMNEVTGEDLSIGGPTGLFSKALRDTGKRISVTSLKGMGLRDDR